MTPPARPAHVLALLPNWIGDTVMATPALRALNRRFPDALLTVAGPATSCGVLRGLPWIRALVEFPTRPGLGAMLRLRRSLRHHAPEVAVVFPHSFRAALTARFSGARRRIGYARDRRAFLLTHALPPETENGEIRPIYMAKEYLHLVAHLGCEDDGAGLALCTDPQSLASVCEHIPSGDGPLVGIAPGASFGPSKRWPPDRFAEVADQLRERLEARCVLLTGPDEVDIRDAVRAAAASSLLSCDAGNPTVDTLKATVSLLDLLICNDSGPRHVAVAFGIPTVCVMGSTSPAFTSGPYERGEVLRVDVDCGPCQKPECDTDHRCMTEISADRVVEAAMRVLEAS